MDRPPRGRATRNRATQPPHRMRWPSGSEGDYAVRAFTAGIKGRAWRAAVAHHRGFEDSIESELLTAGPAELRQFAHSLCGTHNVITCSDGRVATARADRLVDAVLGRLHRRGGGR